MDDKSRNYKWASSKKRYEWKQEYENGIAPRDKDLEEELFGEDSHIPSGINFSKYNDITVKVKGSNVPKRFDSFAEADLHPVMKENIALARYTIPTPVQRNSISFVTAGRDLMACAQTGSGKTAAFLIPTCSSLFSQPHLITRDNHSGRRFTAKPLVLIVAPTRELCSQIFDEARRFCYRSMLRPCAVYGGAGVPGQIQEVIAGCDVLVAAPGRLLDFMERGVISLSNVKYLILDEADRMLDMGFERTIRNIVERHDLPKDRQTLLYSATFPKEIQLLARDFLRPDYLFLRVGRVGGTTTDITQKVMWVEEQEKREKLKTILLSQPPCRTLIFVDTKRSADSLDNFLYQNQFPSTSIHGDRSQMEREDAILAFKSGTCPILVATAVVARGIDIKNVMHVINFDMVNDIDEYIHRIGRTARVGNAGLATSFFNNNNIPVAQDLTKVLQECQQEIPPFLTQYISKTLRFKDDEDDDDDLSSYQHQLSNGTTSGGWANQEPQFNNDASGGWDPDATPW
ncbi:ATP-dependent RNA helicase DED1 [Halteromyces radiatus]|uniref:ATP-dependent RNA helicase DED1 n=1 Tax=Halteromyces radiatus TaxID=101107 RepID=UPI00221F7798|nr:ATP-dependent RNA helicase DED1 [Halteromyces radiatus]KAI8081726.1 ATP-dependent RNA helicase DED1 [Halteromyces radiatus]